MNSKVRISRILAIALIAVLLVSALSACNFFDRFTKITQVDVGVTNDLHQAENGDFEVGAQGEIRLSVDWHNVMINNPTLRWYVATNGGESSEISGENGKTLTFTVGAAGSAYVFYATANGVESNRISVKVVSGVQNVVIAEPTELGEKNGAGAYEIEAGNDFQLTVNWQDTASGGKRVEWYVSTNGGEKTLNSQTGKTSEWNAVSVGTTYVISAAVNGVESSNSIKVVVIAGDTPVSITFNVVFDGITDSNSNGYAEARFGDEFDVNVDFGGLLITDPVFDWFVSEDGAERKLSGTGESVSFAIVSRDIAHYEFRAVLKGETDTESQNIAKVEFVDFTLATPTIASSSHSVVENKIQQNIAGGGATDVVLSVDWNKSELPADIVTVSWYVDNVVETGETDTTYTFDVSGISSACDKVIKVVLRYKAQRVESTITLSFVEEFSPISAVTLSVAMTADVGWVDSDKAPVTYKMKYATELDPGTIKVTANVAPVGTDLSAPCTWTVRDASGEHTLAATTRTVDIDLAYGKNVITATVQNMPSCSIIVYALTSVDLSARRSVITDVFIWDGNLQDHYINNQQELNIFVGYLVSTHETSADYNGENVHTMYLAPSEWRDGVNVTPAFGTARSIAMKQGVDESGTPAISTYGNTKIYLMDSSVLGEPTEPIFTDYHVSQESVYVRYSEVSSDKKRTKLPVDDFPEFPEYVTTSNQLMRVVSWGYKPKFKDDENGTKLSQLYTKAKSVLRKYVSNDMTELGKVSVIYDWIVNEVVYDYKAAYESTDINVYAYYLEGVFDFVDIDSKVGWNSRAVCDGKSKAFTLLCGMEGIKAMRIIGTAGTAPDPSDWGGHAWNKVLVDADGDGEREWFVVDTTWGDTGLDTGVLKEKKEILTYEYFLTTDAKIVSTHATTMPQPVANTAFDPYSHIVINGVTLDVTTKGQLETLYTYSLTHEKVKIRCRITVEHANWPAGSEYITLSGDEENIFYFYKS